MKDFPVTIFHNPACGTSRRTLALIREGGHEPRVVDYLQVGWTRSELEALFEAMSVRPREMLRVQEEPAAELGLLGPEVSDEAILDAMAAHPILVQRPIVRTPKGARLARPAETVIELLDG